MRPMIADSLATEISEARACGHFTQAARLDQREPPAHEIRRQARRA
jgi:hypothetical protein